ncbi:MAG: T9SS type A sorting domain-containing protein [Sphingobacteriales bacterium JAD_PAG50586_3]|nr:MAG: T9SS type A sorting domain-containing protein [Sphingobacteriales bacterium JAD_PAG50586_3]
MLNQDPNNIYINIWLKSMQNGRFKNYFINRFADVMNTAYLNSRLQQVENWFYNQTVTETPKQFARWGDPNNVPGQMNDYQNNHATFNSQLQQRTSVVREDIVTNFDLPNTVNLTLDVHPAGAGKIHISTIEPTTYPWSGVYFNGVPVKIEAIANQGFLFNHWEANSLITDTLAAVYNDTLDISNIQFDAYFVIDTTTGINTQAANLANFTLYPNPAKSTLMLRYNGSAPYANIALQITDLTGRHILQQNMVNAAINTTVDIGSLAGGVYILRLQNSTGNIQQFRFIKLAE